MQIKIRIVLNPRRAVLALLVIVCASQATLGMETPRHRAVRAVDVHVRNKDRRTPLQEAAFYGCAPIVKVLLSVTSTDHGPPVDWFGTALHIAAARGNEQIVRMLVAAGHDPDVPDSRVFKRCACLQFVVRLKPLEYSDGLDRVTRALLEMGASMKEQ